MRKAGCLFLILATIFFLFGCSSDSSPVPFTPDQALRLADRPRLHLNAKPDPPFLRVDSNRGWMPPAKSGVGALFNHPTVTTQDVRGGQEVLPVQGVEHKTAQLRDGFFSALQERLDLTRVTIRRTPGATDFLKPAISLNFAIREWGLYKFPDGKYRVQFIAETRLVDAAETKWNAMCAVESDPADLSEWRDSGGARIRANIDQLIRLCVEDLMKQFPLRD